MTSDRMTSPVGSVNTNVSGHIYASGCEPLRTRPATLATSAAAAAIADESNVCPPKTIVQQSSEICQQLLALLQNAERTETHLICVDEATQTDELDVYSYAEMVHLENDSLKKKLKELVDMNVKWQTANIEREKYVSELRMQLEGQGQGPLLTQTTGTAGLPEKHSMLEAECRELRSQLQVAQGLVRQLTATVETLRDNLELATKNNATTVEMLEMQIVVYREDFECERRDRERAQSQLAELKMQLELLQCNVNRQSRQLPVSAYTSSRLATAYNRQLRVFDGVWQTDGGGVEVSDCAVADKQTTSSSDTSADGNTQSCVNDDTLLQCPNCRQEFSRDNHLQLVEHLDKCGDAADFIK